MNQNPIIPYSVDDPSLEYYSEPTSIDRNAEIQKREKEAEASEIELSLKQVGYVVDQANGFLVGKNGYPLLDTVVHYYNTDRGEEPIAKASERLPKTLVTLISRVCDSAVQVIKSPLTASPSELHVVYVEDYGLVPLQDPSIHRKNAPLGYYYSRVAMIASRTQMRSNASQPPKLTEVLFSDNHFRTEEEKGKIGSAVSELRPPLTVTVYKDPDALDDLDKDRAQSLRPTGSCKISYDLKPGEERILRPTKKVISQTEERILILDEDNLTTGRLHRTAGVDYRTQEEYYRELYLYNRDGTLINTNPHGSSTSIVSINDSLSEERRANAGWTYDKKTGDIKVSLGIKISDEYMETRTIQTPLGSITLECERSLYGMEQIAYLRNHPLYGLFLSEAFGKEGELTDVQLYEMVHGYFTKSVRELENTLVYENETPIPNGGDQHRHTAVRSISG